MGSYLYLYSCIYHLVDLGFAPGEFLLVNCWTYLKQVAAVWPIFWQIWHFVGSSRNKFILFVFANSRLLCDDFWTSWNSECCLFPLRSSFLAVKFLSSRIALSTISWNLSAVPIRISNSGFKPQRKQSIVFLSRFLSNSASSLPLFFTTSIFFLYACCIG